MLLVSIDDRALVCASSSRARRACVAARPRSRDARWSEPVSPSARLPRRCARQPRAARPSAGPTSSRSTLRRPPRASRATAAGRCRRGLAARDCPRDHRVPSVAALVDGVADDSTDLGVVFLWTLQPRRRLRAALARRRVRAAERVARRRLRARPRGDVAVHSALAGAPTRAGEPVGPPRSVFLAQQPRAQRRWIH